MLFYIKSAIDKSLQLLQTAGTVVLQIPGLMWFSLLGIIFACLNTLAFGIPTLTVWGMDLDEVKGTPITKSLCMNKMNDARAFDNCAGRVQFFGCGMLLSAFFWTLLYFSAVLKVSAALCVSKWSDGLLGGM